MVPICGTHQASALLKKYNLVKMATDSKINKLIALLETVTKLANNSSGASLHHYYSESEFRNSVLLSIKHLKENNFSALNDIYNSFHTDSEWYDFTDEQGKEIGIKIFSLATDLISELESKDILYLIKDFIETANKGVEILRKKFGVTDLLEGWHSRQYEQTGKLKELGIEFYAFHGCGLALHFINKKIDFDFAYTPEQRHDGFDLWRLHTFATGQPVKYYNYVEQSNLEKDFEELLEKQIIYLPEQDGSPKQYFLSNSIKDANTG